MTDIKDTVRAGEIVKALREMLPPKEDYAELVGAEGWAHGQHYVWTDPEPYHIEAAIALIESLQAQLAAEQITSQSLRNAANGYKLELDAERKKANDARNELCLKCGRYHEAHNGACDGCRWGKE